MGPGDVIVGKYRVERVLGRGGMGLVVAATHLQLEERVAIKLLLPEAMQSAEVLARFRREAQASVRLRSEHVCKVLDVGEMDGGVPFIVMECLEGKDLSTLLRERRQAGSVGLPVKEAVLYVLQAAEGLAEAHVLDIVHRDVKPANLFRARRADGTPCVKVLDFGIAKTATTDRQGKHVMGSVHYMSPEQAQRGDTVDARSDIWSLCAVLYQLLAGVSPFQKENLHEVVAAIVTEEPAPVGSLRPDVPPGLGLVVQRGLSKDREQRQQTMVELAAALGPYGGSRGTPQAARVKAVSEERRRSLVPKEESAPGVAEDATRFDHATRTVFRRASTPWRFGLAVAAVVAAVANLGYLGLRVAAPAGPGNRDESQQALLVSSLPLVPAVAPAAAPSSEDAATAPPASREGLLALITPTRTSGSSAPARIVPRAGRASPTPRRSPPASSEAPPAAPAPSPCKDILTDAPIPCP